MDKIKELESHIKRFLDTFQKSQLSYVKKLEDRIEKLEKPSNDKISRALELINELIGRFDCEDSYDLDLMGDIKNILERLSK